MAEQVHPPRTDGVQVTLAIEILQPHALPPADGDDRLKLMILHLGARMPEDGVVALGEGLVGHQEIQQVARMERCGNRFYGLDFPYTGLIRWNTQGSLVFVELV